MNLQKALKITGNRGLWELQAIKKTLSRLELLNTPEEKTRLRAVKYLIKFRKLKDDQSKEF